MSLELVKLEPDPPAIDRHTDFDITSTYCSIISSLVNFFYNSGSNASLAQNLISLFLASVKCGSTDKTTAIEPSISWFSNDKPRKGIDILIEVLGQQVVTTVQSCVWFFKIPDDCIVIFNLGGNRCRSLLTVVCLASKHQVSIFSRCGSTNF